MADAELFPWTNDEIDRFCDEQLRAENTRPHRDLCARLMKMVAVDARAALEAPSPEADDDEIPPLVKAHSWLDPLDDYDASPSEAAAIALAWATIALAEAHFMLHYRPAAAGRED